MRNLVTQVSRFTHKERGFAGASEDEDKGGGGKERIMVRVRRGGKRARDRTRRGSMTGGSEDTSTRTCLIGPEADTTWLLIHQQSS